METGAAREDEHAIIGYGTVGRLLVRSPAVDGADVVVAYRDDHLRAQVETDRLTWTASDLLRQDLDILVPAATGGLPSPETVTGCTIRTVLCLTETARRARTYEAYLTALAATTESDADLVGMIVTGPRNQVTKPTKRLPSPA
ncbi:DUF2000 family protein [Nonomuraea angiospora]|uniref:DUF2000 family protein n=1 Tax=Nonomuraea angiospora TaxID=46172 RepID=UPI00299FE34B|nr:DUF2000 family protein [Nonomuraea angiospora]MDX3101439.1 DUF2000 family protein [Nonomuraea angiospora]